MWFVDYKWYKASKLFWGGWENNYGGFKSKMRRKRKQIVFLSSCLLLHLQQSQKNGWAAIPENHHHVWEPEQTQQQMQLSKLQASMWVKQGLHCVRKLYCTAQRQRHRGKSKLRAPSTCSTLQMSERSTSPRYRQHCFHPDVGMQKSHSARGHTVGGLVLH